MTVKETRDYFEQMVMGGGLYPLQPICQKDMEMTKIALSALEKQIPKKPVKTKNEIVCPTCKTLVGSNPYCKYCGQALDGSETK